MPGTRSDGSITIDTKLDNTGFDRGSDRLRHAVQSLTNEVSATGSRMRDAFKFDFGQPKQQVNSFSSALKQANSEISGLAGLAKQALSGDAGALEQFQHQSIAVYDSLQEMRAELDKYGETAFETAAHAKLSAGYEQATAQVEQLSAALREAEDALDTMTEDFGGSSVPLGLENRIEELQEFKRQYEEAGRRGWSDVQGHILGQAGLETGTFDGDIKKAQDELQKLYEQFYDSKPYKTGQREVDKLTQKLAQAQEQAANYKAKMDATPASFMGSETQNYADANSVLGATMDRLQQVQDAFYGADAAAVSTAGGVKTLEDRLQRVPTWGSLIRGTLGSAFGTIASGAKQAAASLAGMVSSRITGAAKKLGDSISRVGKHSKGMNVSLKGGFRTILKYGLGIRSLYFLFRKLRTALISGITDLSKYDKTLGASVSGFKAALTRLRNSFASAFAPVLKIVLPILTSLINTISTAVSRVGMLIAALTGQKTFMMASATAASSTADATTKADKAAQKYQKTLAGFDDVEILEDKTDNSGSAAGAPAFQETPIDGDLGNLAQMIKDAWKNADFTEIGRMVGEKLKEALEAIPWDKIKDALRHVAKSIATFLNGFLETPGLFSTIGYTIAQGINSAFEFVESFVSNFHWASLGTAIRDLIVGALDNLDWPLIEKTASELGVGLGNMINAALNDPKIWSLAFTTLARAINSLFTLAKNFMLTVKWEEIGKNVGSGIKDGIGKINWLSWGVTLALFVNSIFRFLKGLFATFPWEDLGNGVVEAIRGFFLEFDWKDAGATLYNFLHGLLTALRSFLQNMPWKSLPFYITKSIKDFLEGFDWQGLIDDTIGLIQDALDALIELISGSSKKGEKSPVVSALESLKETVGKIDSKAFEDIATAVGDLVTALEPAVEGFAAGFLDVLNKIVGIGIEFFKMLGPALQAIADAINSLPPETLESLGKQLGVIAGALITIKSAQGVIGFLGGLGTKLGGLAPAGEAAATKVGATAAATEAVGGAAEGAVDIIGGFFGKLFAGAGATAVVQQGLTGLVEGYDNVHFASKDAQKGMEGVTAALEGTGKIAPGYRSQMAEAAGQLVTFGQTGEGFEEAFWGVANVLEESGGDVNTFKQNLSKMLEENAFNEEQAKVIQGYIGDIGTSASDADTETQGLSGAFDAFNGLSLTAPLKLALLALAIYALGSSGKLTQEDTENLQSALDEYDPTDAEGSMGRIQTALEDAGVSAGDMETAFDTAVKSLSPSVQSEYANIKKTIDTESKNTEAAAKNSGSSITEGVLAGLDSKREDLQGTVRSMANDDVLGTIDTQLDSHSPSKETEKRGQYAMDGLINGIQSKKGAVATLVSTVMSDIKSRIDSCMASFRASGVSLMSQVESGMQSMQNSLGQTAWDTADYMYESFDSAGGWHTLGYNAAVGIYNGFVGLNGRLQQMVYNVASNMLAAAENALGIASPSKEFAWIGQMTMAGLAGGIEDTEADAVNAVAGVAQAITDEAQNLHPVTQIETGIDDVLGNFSDKIVNGFENLIAALDAIASRSGFTIPAVAAGAVAPYSARRTASQGQGDSLSDLANAIALRDANRLTREDLTEVLVNVLQQYLNIDFYIGDEQVARHANAGNAKLNRRYSPVTA